MLLQNQIVLDRVCLVETNQTGATAAYIISEAVKACDCRVPAATGVCIAIETSCFLNQSFVFP